MVGEFKSAVSRAAVGFETMTTAPLLWFFADEESKLGDVMVEEARRQEVDE